LQVHLLLAGRGFKAHIHAHFHKSVHNARVLADGPVALGAHAAVDQNLRNRVFGGMRLFALVRFGQASDVVYRMVVADVLQRARNTRNKIFLPDDGHGEAPSANLG